MRTESEAFEEAVKGLMAAFSKESGYSYGWANQEALFAVNQMANAALAAGKHNDYVAEQVNAIKSWSAILFSERKHRRWDTPNQSGADRVLGICRTHAYKLFRWSPTP